MEYSQDLYPQVGLPRWHSGKNPSANARDARDVGLIPGSGRCPGVGNNIFYLENSMDRKAWQATVHEVIKYWTQLSTHVHAHTHTHTHTPPGGQPQMGE